jgi:curved DNA-binding protein CbpA
MEDFYRMLDINEDLDSAQIETNLRTLNREYRQRTNHRDAQVREDALAKLQMINRAMATLGSKDERAKYDQALAGYRAEQELKQPLADIDFYQLLQLAREATSSEIERALAEAETQISSALETDEATTRHRKLIILARHTLLEPARRAAYDQALQEKHAFAARRDANKPVPLQVNGQTVATWESLESVLELHPKQGFELFQDGEIEAWLRWSLHQRQRANWVHELVTRSKQSATPQMEYEEFLRLLNAVRPFRLFAPKQEAAEPLATTATVTEVPALVDKHWNVCFLQFEYLWDWVRLHAQPEILTKYAAYPVSQDTNIQMERLLFCIDPTLPSPELVVRGTDKGVVDFGTIQSWNSAVKELEIVQKGRGYLYGTIMVSAPWIVVTPATFAGAITKLTVKINTLEIKQGADHNGQIMLSPLDGRIAQIAIPVHIQQRSLFQSVKSLFSKD